MHREILGLKNGDGMMGDHIDGNGLNCVRSNLRSVKRAINCRNRVGVRSDNTTSKYLGVSKHSQSGKYWARIMTNGKSKSLGLHDTPEAAHEARKAAELELWGVEPRRAHVFENQGNPEA